MRPPAAFDSVVMAAVTRDLRQWIGARLRRVVQPSAQEIALDLGGRGGATVLISVHARWARVHLSDALPPGEPSSFAQMLRARLVTARLVAIEQPLFERSVTLRFEGDAGTSDLVAEIMGRHSNLVLVQDHLVAGALKLVGRDRSSIREVLPGRSFRPPPRGRPTPADVDVDRLQDLLAGADAPLAQMLSAALLGISPVMGRELAVRAGAHPDLPAAGQVDRADALHRTLQELVTSVRAEAFAPVVYLDADTPVGYAPFPFAHLGAAPHISVPTMSEAVARVTGSLAVQATLDEQRGALAGVVHAALAKAERTEAELGRALAEADDGGIQRMWGELLLTYASRVPAGSREATLPGYDEAPVTVPLDPTLTPVENAQKFFARYAKLRAARPHLQARRAAVAEERHYLESVLAMLESANAPEDLAGLRRELSDEGYLRPVRERAAPPARSRAFTLLGGAVILAGRSNQDNDRITFKIASPDDLWFHARGVPGAHVVLRTGGRAPIDAEITTAASAAAYFSRARGSGTVAVDYTERRFVRKPRGSRPGLVVYERERTVQAVPCVPAR